MIKVVDLHKSFNGKQVLRGVRLEITDGETLTIIGGSGCGKSVLLKNMLALMKKARCTLTGRKSHGLKTRNYWKYRKISGIFSRERRCSIRLP